MDIFSKIVYPYGIEWNYDSKRFPAFLQEVRKMRKTKIICTLGPATESDEIVRELMKNGMDVARFNFSHSTHEQHRVRFEQIVRLREELGLPIAALLDTKGPEIRVGLFKDGRIQLEKGGLFTLTTEEVMGDASRVGISYKNLPNDISDGCRILIDDGLIELRVLSHTHTEIQCEVLNGGMVSNRKGVNVPGVKLSMPYISEQDRSDIIFGAELGFDFIAASFVRCGDDVDQVREILVSCGHPHVRIIAKIENNDGVRNIDEILRTADGVMVARGDMGVEIPFEELPALQKMIIKKAYNAGKQVITATQMLDSMMKNPRPTRAEATDVANAIYDGTSAIMLSGETAAGSYPVEALRTMALIANQTESSIDYDKRFRNREMAEAPNITNAISHATVTTAMDLRAKAILTVTKSGQTARMISKYRPDCLIVGGSTSPMVCRQMNLSWGVRPILIEEKTSNDELFEHAVDVSEEHGLVEDGDLVVITAGVPLGISGTTNMMKVHVVGNILVTGTGIGTESICAPLCVCESEEQARKTMRQGDILVIPHTSNAILDLIKDCAGLITEQPGDHSHAAVVGLALGKPVIVGARGATDVLHSGTRVTLDAVRGIICNMR